MRKKEINTTTASGVYKITCNINRKIYIGSSTNIRKRYLRHMSELRKNEHPNKHLQSSFNKYGETNFIIEILELCSKDNLHTREDYWIKETNCLNKDIGFNKRDKACGGTTVSGNEHYLFGKHLSDETKSKISSSRKGKRAGKNHPLFGKKIPQEQIDRTLKTKKERGLIKLKVKKSRKESKLGSKNPSAKLNEEIVTEIKIKIKNGAKTSELSKEFNISKQTISDIKHNRCWSHINV